MLWKAEYLERPQDRACPASGSPAALVAEQLPDLAEVIRGPVPEGEPWLGRTMAAWMGQQLGRRVSVQVGWVYLVKLDGKCRKPRPRHVRANPVAQERFKKAPSSPPQRRDRVPAGRRRTLGDRRTPHQAKPHLAQDLVFREPAPAGSGPSPLRMALSRGLCPSRLRSHGLLPGDVRQCAHL